MAPSITPYQPKMIHWEDVKADTFLGANTISYTFAIGLTPPEPPKLENCYVTVRPTYRIRTNEKDTFSAVGEAVYQIAFNGNKLHPDVLYVAVKHAHDWFVTEFNTRKQKTVLSLREAPGYDKKDVMPTLVQSMKEAGY